MKHQSRGREGNAASESVQPDRHDLSGELHLVTEMIGATGRGREQEQVEASPQNVHVASEQGSSWASV
jgi:hypothetical protein